MYYALPKSKNDTALLIAVSSYLKLMPHQPDDNFRFAYIEYEPNPESPIGVVVRKLTHYSDDAVNDIVKNLDKLFDLHNV